MDIERAFGSRLKELRKRAGLTQAELAARCGGSVEMQRIGEIERGERNCTLQTIDKLAIGLKCEPASLFLFRSQQIGRALSTMDARLLDKWKSADDRSKQKVIRILDELL